MATRLEQTILKNLIQNEPFIRKTLPYIKSDFFQERDEEFLYKQIKEYFLKYQTPPTPEALIIDIDEIEGVDQQLISDTMVLIRELKQDTTETPDEWLIDSTEKWCKDRAVYNGVMSSISIIQDKDGHQGEIPEILREALSVSFDQNVGHDFIEDWNERYEFMHREEERVPFDLDLMNKITKGGLPNKTLNICMAGTGVGKSLFMCHCASASLLQGKNVLYITMEMAEEKIAERIDANLLDISLNDLGDLPKMMYEKKITRVREKTKGKLIIKEYPTATAHSGHIRHLLQELDLKREFKPEIIFIDYLNICSSFRIRPGSNVNTYSYIKSIAEELRGLAVEFDVPIMSATQTNRTGFVSTDVGLEDTSESFGLPATADFMFALISTEEMQELDQVMVKQLKNRYNDPGYHKRFVLGVDRSKMRLYDCEQSAQDELVDIGPVMDNTTTGKRINSENTNAFKYD
jgi:archaellum biogenesis ATPase FlaH